MSRPRGDTARALNSSDLTRLVAGLVVLMIGAVVVLVVAFWRSAAAGRARAWTAAEQVAHSYNQEFQARARARLGASLSRQLALGSGATSGQLLPMLASLTTGSHVPGVGLSPQLIQPRYAFLVDPANGALVIVGDTTGLPARQRAARAGTEASSVAADQIYGAIGTDSAGPWLIYYRAIALADGRRAAYGFEMPSETMDTAFLQPSLVEMRSDRWGDAPFRDSVFSVEALLHDSVVFTSRPHFAGGPSASGQYPAGFQFLHTRLTLNPAAAHHVLPGGIPSVPRAALLALLLLAALLGAAALFLLYRARALVTLREDFTSAVSHELRTPLTQILLYAEMLSFERGDQDARRRAGLVIAREARRLIHLVENVLAFARGRRTEVRLALAVHDLSALTAVVVHDAAALAGKFDASLTTDLATGVAAEVDPDAYRQIVLNLVDNALRYGPAGQQVRIALAVEDDHAVLRVDDQGPGVPEPERERIWRPYERLAIDGARAAGTGIGLAIVVQLVTLLRGTASVTDAPGGGARFVVRLPLIAALDNRPATGNHEKAGTWPRS